MMTPKQAFEHVFLNQYWGNKNNSGKGAKGSYKRPYSKTKNDKGLLKNTNTQTKTGE